MTDSPQPISALRDMVSEAGDVYRDLQTALDAGLLSEKERIDLRRFAHEIEVCARAMQVAELDA